MILLFIESKSKHYLLNKQISYISNEFMAESRVYKEQSASPSASLRRPEDAVPQSGRAQGTGLRAQGSGHHPSTDKPGFDWQSREHKEQSTSPSTSLR